MFSHAFEEVGKELKRKSNLDLKMVKHEHVTDVLIRHREVSEILNQAFGSGFANDVADLIGRGYPKRIYDSVVSSQFDADRLDYMQRDRLMTGVQNSGIDLTWLLANMETGTVQASVDEENIGEIETFALGPKAAHAAETYILGLFQLYPTVYFHKATRGAETLFTALMVRLMTLVRDGSAERTGLPNNHPFVRFAIGPEQLDNALLLDDTVFWGALSSLAEAADPLIGNYALRLRDRHLLKCVDIRERLLAKLPAPPPSADTESRKKHAALLARLSDRIKLEISDWNGEKFTNLPRILIDQAHRSPYKRFQDSDTPLNQIHIRIEDDKILDVAERSAVVAALEPFELFRVYVDRHDDECVKKIGLIIDGSIENEGKDDGQA
jgi:HD superfamily phosphohydrolase